MLMCLLKECSRVTLLSLDGDWKLRHFPEGNPRILHPEDLPSDNEVSARVPGNVELDLHRAGQVPEPFFANNIHLMRQFETHEWWYTRDFDVPEGYTAQPCDLVFGGLDTLATVWVNGVEVGHAANMLIEHRFDVTAALRPGARNTIAVRLASAVNFARTLHYDVAASSGEGREEGLFIRKAPHMWGWDIMPRAVTAGIWRSVAIEQRPEHAIEQLYYWTADVAEESATLGVRFQFRTSLPAFDQLAIRFRGVCGDDSFEFTWPVEFIAGGCRIPVPAPQLWWPKGYGEPHLYTVTAQLLHDGVPLTERVDRIGIRKVVVERTETGGSPLVAHNHSGVARYDLPSDPDHHFLFKVNDTPIMVKGANWVPLDAFHSRDAERVGQAIDLFDDLGCNMIRCWGGNVYEDHAFFDLCDEKGMLVWQDFAFACCLYPQTEEFLAQVRVEAQAVVEKLRNHASLAIWCGDNENDMGYVSNGLLPAINRLTREVIPHVINRCDPFRAYVPSSPFVPPALGASGQAWMYTPEQHLWGPRGYFKNVFYTQHTANFIGEIGYHGSPNVASIKRFISPEKLWPWQDNAEWQTHAVYHWQHTAINRDRIQLMANQVRELFGTIPEDLESFALASQISQAEAKKFFIESTRLRKWQTSGILWWNVIDGWPQFSDAIVDYYFGKKLAYHYIRRVQHPVCVMIGEAGPSLYLPVVIGNDSRADAAVRYRVWDADSGETAAEGEFVVPANQNYQVARIRTFAAEQRLLLISWEVDGQSYGNHYLVGQPALALEQYRAWLPALAALPQAFDAQQVGQ